MTITAIIAFIFVFGVLVAVHEFGHFIVAKKTGVLVREFSIGMGPKLLSWYRNHTAYTIRILPVGGYVRMAGMDDDPDLEAGQRLLLKFDDQGQVIQMDTRVDENVGGLPFQVDQFDLTDALTLTGYQNDSQEVETLKVNHDATIVDTNGIETQIAPRDTWVQSAKIRSRILINFAGPFMNFVLAFVVFTSWAFMQPSIPSAEPVIGSVMAGSAAQQAGLQADDRVKSVNGHTVKYFSDFVQDVSSSRGRPVKIVVSRHNQEKAYIVTPVVSKTDQPNQQQIGVTSKNYTDIGSRLKYGISATGSSIVQVSDKLLHIFDGGFSLNKLGGPVMLARETSDASKAGFLNVLFLTALLSVNLGIINLLPIPPLDGGKLVLNFTEGIIRRPLPHVVENSIAIAGAVFVMGLMVAVTINDILR
ncbi:RIP metalloprotease RseP [Lactobacillaceae bacterium L1_55_11]|nr:RIP metalloprotease RseP [Lactobacillaceae bacterium L1_55_11]